MAIKQNWTKLTQQLFFQLDRLFSLQRGRIGLVLVTTASFLTALAVYYLTGFLKYRPELYSADLITLPALYTEMIHGGDFMRWAGGSVPFIFPDTLLFWFLQWSTGSLHLSIALYGIAQIAIFAVGLLFLTHQLFQTRRLEVYLLLMLAGTLFFAGLPYFARATQLFAASVQHFGIIVVWPYLLGLTIALLKSPTPRRWLSSVALAVLLFLTVLSDLFAVTQIVTALLGAAVLLLLLRKTRFKAVLLVSGLILGSSAAGYLVMRLIPVFSSTFVMAAQNSSVTDESLASLIKTFQDIAARYPLQAILISAVIGLSITVIAVEARLVIRRRAPSNNYVVAYAAAVLIIFLTNAVAVVVTGAYKAGTERYILPILFLPVFGGLIFVLVYFLTPRWLLALASLGSLLLIGFLLINTVTLLRGTSGVRYDDYYPGIVKCLDENAGRLGLTEGIADYWQAKPLSTLSKTGLRIAQVTEDLNPYPWFTYLGWYDIEPEFAVADNARLSRAAIESIYGPPAGAFECAPLEILVYNRSTDDYFQSQFRNSIYLARLEQPGDSTATDAVFLPTIIGHTAGLHRVVKNGPAGYLTYGPYLTLPVGNYSFEISYSAKSQSENVGHWDVAVSEGVIAQGNLPTSGQTVRGCFLLTNPGPVQIRTFYNGSGKLTVKRIGIAKESEACQLLNSTSGEDQQ